ncbi:hypothetical protein QTG54_004139 [Skeletonema marinoi]|uniref:Uncharacterized protein n=1 Tax=Skeletonema marinoi TaxID=267567 RepID=A0AAD8YEH3_9STRA|nr:hypothetical protein QTG54_004139 [Skeletonema marinoi]
MRGISSRFLLLSTCVYSASGHDDLEGYCAAVLPAYQNDPVDGNNEIEFVGCECEDSHSGKEQTLVVCTFIKDIALQATGSCNAKFCLFTQQCEEPDDFNVLGLGVTFDLSLFDEWCVDENTNQKETNPTRYPSQSPMGEIEWDQNTTNAGPSMPQIKDTTSQADRTLSSFGIVILGTTLIRMHAI